MSYAPIMGGRYRGYAQAVQAVLPNDAILWLVPEPTNQYDPDAIAVHAPQASIPESARSDLAVALAGFGLTPFEVDGEESHHIGYLPSPTGKWAHLGTKFREELKLWVEQFAAEDIHPKEVNKIPVRLCFTPEGKPAVRLP